MTGARITLELDDGAARSALAGLGQQLDDNGRTLLLEGIGEYLMGATRDRAALQVSPDGEPWAILSPRYAKRKAKLRPGAPLLKFDYHMLGDQLSSQVIGDTLYHGTNAVYGARQQFGGGGITARPWLGLSEADDQEVMHLVLDHLQQPLSGGAP